MSASTIEKVRHRFTRGVIHSRNAHENIVLSALSNTLFIHCRDHDFQISPKSSKAGILLEVDDDVDVGAAEEAEEEKSPKPKVEDVDWFVGAAWGAAAGGAEPQTSAESNSPEKLLAWDVEAAGLAEEAALVGALFIWPNESARWWYGGACEG